MGNMEDIECLGSIVHESKLNIAKCLLLLEKLLQEITWLDLTISVLNEEFIDHFAEITVNCLPDLKNI
jgi:hypothetical protein